MASATRLRLCGTGRMFAAEIRRQRVSHMRGFRHWRWHLDEMYVKFIGEMVYLWRAVVHEGEILEVLRYEETGQIRGFGVHEEDAEAPWQGRDDRHGRAAILPCGDARPGKSRPPRNREVVEQSGRKQSSPATKKGAGDAEVPANEIATEIRLGPCFLSQSFQFRTPPRRPPNIQGSPLSCIG